MYIVPTVIKKKMNELNELIEKNPDYISVVELAKFLKMKPDGLRNCIDNGKCPFGIGWKINARGNRAYKIPTATFYLWYTHHAEI